MTLDRSFAFVIALALTACGGADLPVPNTHGQPCNPRESNPLKCQCGSDVCTACLSDGPLDGAVSLGFVRALDCTGVTDGGYNAVLQ